MNMQCLLQEGSLGFYQSLRSKGKRRSNHPRSPRHPGLFLSQLQSHFPTQPALARATHWDRTTHSCSRLTSGESMREEVTQNLYKGNVLHYFPSDP